MSDDNPIIKPLTHNQLQESLACHLRANKERMVWTDTQLGPSGSPRPDVFTVGYSFSKPARDAYEIKVSMSDLRRDTTSGKWQQYLKFAHRVWFAFDKGLAPHDVVPRECGIILRDPTTGNWRSARKPIAQVQATMPHDAWLKLLMTRQQRGFEPVQRRADDWHLADVARKKFGDELGQLLHDRLMANHVYEQATEAKRAQAETIKKAVEEAREHAVKAERWQQARMDEQERKLAQALGLTDYGKVTREELMTGIAQLAAALSRFNIDHLIERLQALDAITTDYKQKRQQRREEAEAANDPTPSGSLELDL